MSMSRPKILVVMNEQCAGDSLARELVGRVGDEGAEVLIVAPALTDRLRFWLSDIDAGAARAEARIEGSEPSLAGVEGLAVRSAIGDEDPLQAIDDALVEFPADEIIITTHPLDEANWLERAVVAQARSRYELPITHLEVERPGVAERDPDWSVPDEMVRERHRVRDWTILLTLAFLAVAGTWVSYVFYIVDAPLWLTTVWVLVADLGFKFVALPVALWVLFQRRARPGRLDY
jgi:hypothetical protein